MVKCEVGTAAGLHPTPGPMPCARLVQPGTGRPLEIGFWPEKKKIEKKCTFLCPVLRGRRGAAARLNRSHAPVSTSGGLREGLI